MITRSLVAVATTVAALSAATPAHALGDLATPGTYVITTPDAQAVGSCSFLFSGPSLNPSSTPYHVVGYVTVKSAKPVASTSIRCRLRLSYVSGRPQVGQTLAQAAPGSSTSVVGDITVNTSERLEICTWVDATFFDTTRLNASNTEACRLLTNPLAFSVNLNPKELVGDPIFDPPPPPPTYWAPVL